MMVLSVQRSVIFCLAIHVMTICATGGARLKRSSVTPRQLVSRMIRQGLGRKCRNVVIPLDWDFESLGRSCDRFRTLGRKNVQDRLCSEREYDLVKDYICPEVADYLRSHKNGGGEDKETVNKDITSSCKDLLDTASETSGGKRVEKDCDTLKASINLLRTQNICSEDDVRKLIKSACNGSELKSSHQEESSSAGATLFLMRTLQL